tara:strand:- start:5652 stop:6593 length:942 start_codon:yes stop_codon:yes gene_type:complete
MKLKELIIISVCLVIPLIFSVFLKMNFFITVFASLSISAVGLYLLKKNKFAGKLLAAASTLGIFMAIGNTVYWILNSIIMITMMYFYVTTDNIEDTLFKIIVLLATVTIVGLWNQKNTKEGFLDHVSDSLTKRGCQDYCANTKNCKYAIVPSDNSRGKCEITQGMGQYTPLKQTGNREIWRNEKFVKIEGKSSGTYKTPNSGKSWKGIMINFPFRPDMIPERVYLEGDLGDQNWGNSTRGLYIRGYKGNSQVFNKSIVAPRTSGYKKKTGEWWGKDLNPNNSRIDRIEVFAYSRGSGHAIRAKNASFTVIGTK